MIIGVKATKSDETEADPQERYRLPAEKRSRLPKHVAILLTGIALYLKSFFPSFQQSAANEEPEGGAGDQQQEAPTELKLVAGTNSEPDLDYSDVGSTSQAQGSMKLAMAGSGGRLLEPQGPALYNAMMEMELPKLSFPVADLLRNFGPMSGTLRAANDNPGGAVTGGAPGGSHGSNSQNPDDSQEWSVAPVDDDDEDRDDDDTELNRAPRNSGPVQLYDVAGCAAILIAMSELLRNTMDPDGDALSISNLSISSGSLTYVSNGWLFQPGDLGPVTIAYQVTDGEFTVWQSAYFSVTGSQPIKGTAGSDIIVGTEYVDEIDAKAGDDNVDARGGNDTINGGTGDDNIVAGSGNDIVFAGAGHDVVIGGIGDDWISGGTGNDRLFGDAGKDTIFGDEGDDQISGGADDDLVFGGLGNDILSGDAGNDLLDGGEGDDLIHGGSENDKLFGHDGADSLNGNAGDDLLEGGAGTDIVRGGEGNDTVIGDIDGASDIYAGDAGYDTLDYSVTTSGIAIYVCAETAEGLEIGSDTISGFEAIKGGSGDDHIIGSDGAEHLVGNAGNDVMADGGGCDRIEAGPGDDTVLAAADAANDSFFGQAGLDTISYAQAGSGVVIDMENRTATGVAIGNDTIEGFERVIGGTGNDHLVAASDTISLRGGAGQDIFEFNPTSEGAAIIQEILDFMVGDRIRISQYDLFEEVIDTLEDRFEDIYGDQDEDDLPIRIRHEQTDEISRTLIEADFDRDGHQELTISLDGHRVFMFVEIA